MPSLIGCAFESGLKEPAVTTDVERMFQSAPYSALRSIRCQIDDQSLVLTGTVPSFYLKQLAQTQVALLVPSMRLENRIEVPERILETANEF